MIARIDSVSVREQVHADRLERLDEFGIEPPARFMTVTGDEILFHGLKDPRFCHSGW